MLFYLVTDLKSGLRLALTSTPRQAVVQAFGEDKQGCVTAPLHLQEGNQELLGHALALGGEPLKRALDDLIAHARVADVTVFGR